MPDNSNTTCTMKIDEKVTLIWRGSACGKRHKARKQFDTQTICPKCNARITRWKGFDDVDYDE